MSPGSTSASGTWLMPSLEPSVGRISVSGSSSTPERSLYQRAIASRSSASPK